MRAASSPESVASVDGFIVTSASSALKPAFWSASRTCGKSLGAVITSVHHAEVVAHRVGEPFGTLVLAIAITIIEVALIV